MLKFISILLSVFFIGIANNMEATHIVGGEIYYVCLGNNQYKVTFKIYRDCYNGQAAFDNPAYLGIYEGSALLRVESMYTSSITNIPVIISNPCLVAPPNVCVEEAIYEKTITLPSNVPGYDLVYQRCCRNNTIVNLINPGDQGATYIEHIPGTPFTCNSSPYFANFPPIAICTNDPLHFDHSAIDPDGDSLAYNLCVPFIGASPADPQPNPPSPPPYQPVNYTNWYNHISPLSASPNLSIDPITGIISGMPTLTGQFVVGVCVREFRNGILIGNHRRDFQFNVANCNKQVDAIIPITGNDTSINHCESYTLTFGNNSRGATSYHWDFGVVSVSTDTSNKTYPVFTFPDTGTFRVTLIANPGLPCTDTDRVTVKIYPLLKASFQIEEGCPGDSLKFQDFSSTDFGSIDNWKWKFGDGTSTQNQNPVKSYLASGQYNVTLSVKNIFGCVDHQVKQVKVHPVPRVNFSIEGNCIIDSINIINHSSISSGVVSQWRWDFGDNTPIDTNKQPNHIFNSSGNFNLKLVAVSDMGCTDSISKPFEIIDIPVAEAGRDTTVCAKEPVQLFASGGDFYSWAPPLHINNFALANPVVNPNKSMVYTVTVANTCYHDTATVKINIMPLPDLTVRKDTVIYYGESVEIYGISQTGIRYVWKPNYAILNPVSPTTVASPTRTTKYSITVTDANGCNKTGFVTVFVEPICDKLFMPNAFTPNEDGINDRFFPIDYGQNELVSFKVFNRWGQKLFESVSFEHGWDGKFNKILQGMDTYVYVVHVICGYQTIYYKGNFTLIR